jgi:hypothetical protein
LDAGPPLTFCQYSLQGGAIDSLWAAVRERDVATLRATEGERLALFQEIRRRGALREAPMLLATLSALAAGRVRIEAGRILDPAGHPAAPLDLSLEVDRALGPLI